MFAYCNNNPVSRTDPTGEFFLTALIVGTVVGAVVGGAIGGTAAYNSAKESGATGSDLFWETVKGVGKGAVIGGVAGGLIGGTGGAMATYGATSVARTAMITATTTTLAKATEVGVLQGRASSNRGASGWQIANDCIDAIFCNGLNVSSSLGTKALLVGGSFAYKSLVHSVSFNDFLDGTPMLRGAASYLLSARACYNTYKAITCDDPIERANERGYYIK